MATNNNWNNQIAAANSAIILNSGTNNVNISTDASATTVAIGTGAAAKSVTVGSTNGASSLALKIGTADFSLASATGTIMSALDTGEITYPLQSSFLAIAATQSNVTGDGTNYTPTFTTEVYDQNSDFDGTSTFTAPVTGRYLFTVNIYSNGNTASITLQQLQLVASNRTMSAFWKPATILSGSEITYGYTSMIDMDAADTISVRFQVSGITKVVGIVAGSSSNFSGTLIC